MAAHSLKHTWLYHHQSSSQRENEAEREKQALSSLPHSSNTLTGNSAASRALYDNPGSSSALKSATKVHLRFSLSTIFLNNAISTANYTFHTAHYSLPGDRRTQAWHTSLVALFTQASALSLTVAPLHFHINSSKAWWNQPGAGGKLRITTVCSSIQPLTELSLTSQTQLQETSQEGNDSAIYSADELLKEKIRSASTDKKIWHFSLK